MVHDAVEAFIKQDVEEAEEIIRRDDEVDALFNQVKTDVVELLSLLLLMQIRGSTC